MTTTERERTGSVTLYIYGDLMDPDEITSLLGVKPNQAWRMGDNRKLPSGSSARSRTGLWTFSIPIIENELGKSISELLCVLGDDIRGIQNINGVESSVVDIYESYGKENFDSSLNFLLPSAEMKLLADANIDFELTIHLDSD